MQRDLKNIGVTMQSGIGNRACKSLHIIMIGMYDAESVNSLQVPEGTLCVSKLATKVRLLSLFTCY
jgi:hypothetical protein